MANLSNGSDVALILTWLVFVFWEPVVMGWKKRVTYYEEHRHLIPFAPRADMFMWTWPLVHTMLALSAFFYFESQTDADKYYIAQFVLFVVGIMISKFWTPTFFYMRRFWLALLLTLVMIGCAIGSLVLFALDSGYHNHWWSFGLLMPYATLVTLGGFIQWYWASYADRGYMVGRVAPEEQNEIGDYESEYESGV